MLSLNADKVLKRKESALSIFTKAKKQLEKLIDDVHEAQEKLNLKSQKKRDEAQLLDEKVDLLGRELQGVSKTISNIDNILGE